MSVPRRSEPPATRSLEDRLAEVEARQAIAELTGRYNFCVDGRDLEGAAALFTDAASFGSKDGAMRAVGREAIVRQFKDRFAVMGASNHVAHDHVVWFEGATLARGRLSVHAEAWRNERAMVTAMTYEDRYEKFGGLWYFAERLLSFFYYLPVDEYVVALGRLDRNRALGVPTAADYPERLPGYVEYRPVRPPS